MFLGHDATWWGIALGIIAIVLIVPGAVLSNFLTVYLQNKIAQWVNAAPLKMLDKLSKRRLEMEAHGPVLTEIEDWILRGIQCACKLISFGVQMFGIVAFLIGLVWLKLFRENENIAELKWLFLVAFGCFLLTWLWQRAYIRRLDILLNQRSPINRQTLYDQIDGWKKRAREQGHSV